LSIDNHAFFEKKILTLQLCGFMIGTTIFKEQLIMNDYKIVTAGGGGQYVFCSTSVFHANSETISTGTWQE